jgi:hypothetical protein
MARLPLPGVAVIGPYASLRSCGCLSLGREVAAASSPAGRQENAPGRPIGPAHADRKVRGVRVSTRRAHGGGAGACSDRSAHCRRAGRIACERALPRPDRRDPRPADESRGADVSAASPAPGRRRRRAAHPGQAGQAGAAALRASSDQARARRPGRLRAPVHAHAARSESRRRRRGLRQEHGQSRPPFPEPPGACRGRGRGPGDEAGVEVAGRGSMASAPALSARWPGWSRGSAGTSSRRPGLGGSCR